MLIGLAGFAGAGKDSVASVLVELHGFHRVGFADRIKAMALELNPMILPRGCTSSRGRGVATDLHTLVGREGWETAKQTPHVRAYLQRLGMAVRTHIGVDTWVDAAFRSIPADTADIVIPDVRFDNEVDAIRARGGVVWLIARPGISAASRHESEALASRPLAFFDVAPIINRTGKLSELPRIVKTALRASVKKADEIIVAKQGEHE